MRKKSELLCPVVFCVFIGLMAILLLLSDGSEYSQREKRYLAQAPVISVESTLDGSCQKSLESWVEDQFPLRDTYVAVNSYWMLATGRNALQNTYFAKDDYLIKKPAASDLTMFRTTMERFDAFAEKCDLQSTLVMVPDHGWLQADRLPFAAEHYLDDECFQTARSLLKNVDVLDFRNALLQADDMEAVCYRTDHHLTAWGNYSLYRAWCESRGVTAREKKDYKIEETTDFYGTAWSGSGYWLTDPDKIQLWDNGQSVTVTITDGGEEPVSTDGVFYRDHLKELDKYPVYLDGNHCQVDIINPDADGGTLLLIKDSYAHCFVTFLTEHYSRIIMLDLRYYRGSISDFVVQNEVDELLFFYGTSTLLSDTNSAWLF